MFGGLRKSRRYQLAYSIQTNLEKSHIISGNNISITRRKVILGITQFKRLFSLLEDRRFFCIEGKTNSECTNKVTSSRDNQTNAYAMQM